MTQLNRTLAIAPMMDWTDRHYRYLMRIISKNTLLYTEMINTGAIIHGDRERFLKYHSAEHPVAIQLGGSNPNDLAQCTEIANQAGYDEVNLNVGCPSDRVQAGRFGACLMKEPKLVQACIRAMISNSQVPVTVKCRIGVDDYDSYEFFKQFILTVADSGCDTFIIHARKAWLSGLSPKENRTKPPLMVHYVAQIMEEAPELQFVLNGNITDPVKALHEMPNLAGVMIGREAYQNPYLFADLDQRLFGATRAVKTRREIITEYSKYAKKQIDLGQSIIPLIKHCLGLFHGQPGAKNWRYSLSQYNYHNSPQAEVLLQTLDQLPSI